MAEGRFVQAMTDLQIAAPAFVFTGRHRFDLHEMIMQTGTAAKPQSIAHFQQRTRLFQQMLAAFQCQHLQKTFGCGAGPAAEQALEMERAQMDMGRDFIQAGLVCQPFLDKGDGPGHTIIVGHGFILLQVRLMETPPSTSNAVPVVKLEASDARYNAERAISSGAAKRLRACRFCTNTSASGVLANSRAMGVSVPPGNSALTRMPWAPASTASTCTRPIRPALLDRKST